MCEGGDVLRKGCGATLTLVSRMSNFSRDLRDQGRRSKSKNFLRRIHRRYRAKMVGVSGGFGKGMF